MENPANRPCTAFAGMTRLARGPLRDVALAVKAADAGPEPLLVFDDATGAVVDLDLRGSAAEIVARLSTDDPAPTEARRTANRPGAAKRGRGRPKLGVVAREVTLLPRHWDWLAQQRGGASAALRRLVDDARRADGGLSAARRARDAAYRFISGLAGDLPGFEEATRALFADDHAGFAEHTARWPRDVREHALVLARGPHAAATP